MDTQHDSLAQVPINSVLIGIFAEKLKTISEPGSKYPEYITIQGGPATNTTARTYKFKTLDVFKYLEGIKSVIKEIQDNFGPDEFHPLKGINNSSSGSASNKSENISAKNEELDKEPNVDQDAKPENTSEKDDAVGILDEPESSSELGETQEPITPKTNQVKAMNGGGARKHKARRLKYSLKNCK
jgi:hypothetical protein